MHVIISIFRLTRAKKLIKEAKQHQNIKGKETLN